MKLLLIRHAESLGNVDQRIQGRQDQDLSDQGRLQAQTLGTFLAANLWQPSHLYSSSLKRAVQTAQLLLAPLPTQPPTQYIQELQELNNGIFDGLTWQEAETRYPQLCQALMTSAEWIPIPEAESLQAIRDRAQAFLQALLRNHGNQDQIWIVSHGGFLQYLVAAILGSDRVWGLSISPTALFEFWLDLERWSLTDQNRWNPTLWQIRRFNQVLQQKTEG